MDSYKSIRILLCRPKAECKFTNHKKIQMHLLLEELENVISGCLSARHLENELTVGLETLHESSFLYKHQRAKTRDRIQELIPDPKLGKALKMAITGGTGVMDLTENIIITTQYVYKRKRMGPKDQRGRPVKAGHPTAKPRFRGTNTPAFIFHRSGHRHSPGLFTHQIAGVQRLCSSSQQDKTWCRSRGLRVSSDHPPPTQPRALLTSNSRSSETVFFQPAGQDLVQVTWLASIRRSSATDTAQGSSHTK
ncbi:hypothetical protein J6590_053961 [Homalodisca vitripennis]|nr:hypothetical protein J6590_053961 [Homalodisca vitripennis]